MGAQDHQRSRGAGRPDGSDLGVGMGRPMIARRVQHDGKGDLMPQHHGAQIPMADVNHHAGTHHDGVENSPSAPDGYLVGGAPGDKVVIALLDAGPGDLLVFLSYLKAMFRPMQDFAKYTGRLAKASAAGERIVSLFDQEPDITDRPDARPAPSLRGHIEFEGVTFGYEQGHSVLHNISFTIQPGRRVALVGPSGHGKSTLLNLILRLYDATIGSVLLDGHDVRDLKLASLRSQIAVVLQDNLLFAASIRDNIAYGALEATDDEIEAAARLANAHEFISAMPEGYDTMVGEQGSTLSTGQRQRLAIARAAVRQAPILLLDEPTTGLDEENERVVVDALDRLAKGHTTLLVTHHLRHAARCETILYLDQGRLTEAGSHAELMRLGGSYARLYRLEESGFAPAVLQPA